MSSASSGPLGQHRVVLLVLVLVAALTTGLTAGLSPAVAGSSQEAAKAKPRTITSISVVMTPSRVTVYENGAVEPAGFLAVVKPATAGRDVTFYREGKNAGTATTDKAGHAFLPLTLTTADLPTDQHQVFVTANASVTGTKHYKGAASSTVTLSAYDNTQCGPRTAPVDKSATGSTYCLATRLDAWASSSVMGVGQQLNVSSKPWTKPVDGLRPAPAVIGFDLEELDKAATYRSGTYDDEVISDLIERAHDGAVLVASWHATNPWTKGPFTDTRHGSQLARLVKKGGPQADRDAYDRFWSDWDAKLDLLKRFQDDDAVDGIEPYDTHGDGLSDHGPCWCTSVVVRPLHEANGNFFWWGKRDPKTYRALFAALQQRAADRGVHNVLWAFSANRYTRPNTVSPQAYRPAKVDIGGLDTYDPDYTKADAADKVNLEGYSAIKPRGGRRALTEVGPHGSVRGDWNPATILRTAHKAKIRPLWAMLWFDDGKPTRKNPVPGRKQITSLTGGRSFLKSCFAPALCFLG